MRLTPETTLFTLVEEYPFLEPYLDRFGAIGVCDTREARRKIGRMITLRHLALLAATPLPSLLVDLHDEILGVTGEAPELGPVTATHVDQRRVEAFAAIVRDLYEGGDLDELKARFGELMEHTHGSEFAALAQELSDGDRGADEIARLYERHALMFASPDGAEVVAPAGHPLHTCEAELHVLGLAGSALRTSLERLGSHPSSRTWETLEGTFVGALTRVCEVERHLRRIENLVLPLLAGRQGEGPAQLLEEPSARLCDCIAQARAAARGRRRQALIGACGPLLEALHEVLYKEERILLPLAMEKISAAEWRAVRAAEAEYGWAIIPEPLPWPRSGGTLRDKPDDNDDGDGMTRLTLATGTLSAEQIGLVLMNLPFDLTFADEQGLVRFSSGGERVFAHTPTIIGRPMVGCHEAVDRGAVQRIITAFEAGERDRAEFWFADGERFVYVLFRPVREHGGTYRGVLEVCYDATDLRTLAARDLFDPPRVGARVRATTPITDGLRPGDGEILLDYGTLTVAQLNLMLAAVPADFSFGDEHDILLHFSEGGIYEDCDRGVIGGTMQECHPSGAQAALQRVLDEFRGGRTEAFEAVEQEGEVWTLLRYTPVRTADGVYRGILECKQDITRLRRLEGERRELDW